MIADLIYQLTAMTQNSLSLFAYLFDFMLKSMALVLAAKYYERVTSPFFSSAQKYKLWLTVLVLLGLLPVMALINRFLFGGIDIVPNLNLVTVLVPSEVAERADDTSIHYHHLLKPLVGFYAFVLALHLTKLGVSINQIIRIHQNANFHCPASALRVLHKVRLRLGVSRPVRLGTSELSSSPMTYGTFRPTIILPAAKFYEDEDLLESILLHEIGHIQRYDHAIYLLCYLVAALNWFNPCVWIALRKLELESEYACDNEVLRHSNRPSEFAGHLLNLAKWGLHRQNAELTSRAMIRRGQLSLRVENILHNYASVQSGKTYSSLLPIATLIVIFLLTSTGKIFALENEREFASEELRLIYKELPAYPDAAFEKRITGFAQFSFRVDALGRVDPNSIVLKRSDPNRLFEEPSISALNNFVFAPRKVNGRRVSTSGVSYTFEFDIRI